MVSLEGRLLSWRGSRSVDSRWRRVLSSSRVEGRLRLRLIQEGLPVGRCCGGLSTCIASLFWALGVVLGAGVDFSTSAFTPTIASLPSLKLTWAEPLVSGSMPVSALKGRKSVAERESARIGGWEESDVWRYESSAGESEGGAEGGISPSMLYLTDQASCGLCSIELLLSGLTD